MARQEFSAGIVVFHRGNVRAFLLLDYGKHWDFPKGHLEKNEDDLTAALRELEEETGIKKVELADGFAKESVYFFRHPRRGLTRKKVIFYLAAVKQKKVTISHEHVGYDFLPFDEALDRLTYPTAKQLLRDANDYLQQHDV